MKAIITVAFGYTGWSYLAIDDQDTEYKITMEYIKSNEANPEEIGLNYVSIFKTDPDSDEIIRVGRTWE